MTAAAAHAVWVDGISAENQPGLGSAPGWPLVVYFHHVHPKLDHYTSVTPDEFRHGIELVLEHFSALDPYQAEQPDQARRSVLFTFDDGYADNVEFALPVLAEFDVRAVFFQVTGSVGASSPGNPRASYMSAADHRRLLDAGHRIGAHTVTHRRLTEFSDEEARREVAQSVAWSRRTDPDHPVLFAYPYGVEREEVLPRDELSLSFATVRAPALPWSKAPHAIRRTYLPTNAIALWPDLVKGWSQQWGA